MLVHEIARKWGINSEGVIAALQTAQSRRRAEEHGTEDEEREDTVETDVERVLHAWTLSGAIEQYRM